jgi:hypothetical protein
MCDIFNNVAYHEYSNTLSVAVNSNMKVVHCCMTVELKVQELVDSKEWGKNCKVYKIQEETQRITEYMH